MLSNLLIYRFSIFNAGAVGLLAYFWSKGYWVMAYEADPTGIVIAIAVLFFVVWLSSWERAWKTSKAINNTKRGLTASAAKSAKRLAKIEHIHSAASWLAYLGILGTVVGFIIALSSVRGDVGSLASAQGVAAFVPVMLDGMGVAVWTTLAGGFFGLWTEINSQMLKTATRCLVEDERSAVIPDEWSAV